MTGAVIENLSNQKLTVILGTLLALQVSFFLIGAWFSPQPTTSMVFSMTKCSDPKGGRTKEWFHLRPMKCDSIDQLEAYHPKSDDVRDIVFIAQMPHYRDGHQLEYSPWFQFLLGMLDVEIEYNPAVPLKEKVLMELEIRLGYKTKQDSPTTWHDYIETTVQRTLECSIDPSKKTRGHFYNCSAIDLFELGSNSYPFYLLNIRLPINKTRCRTDPDGPNCGIGLISGFTVVAVHQNGGFTAIWLWMKTFISPVVILANLWYYSRVKALNRPKYLIEKAIMALGISLCILDFPIEWISLWFRLPFMLLVGDLRQGLFYTVLFSFWLIFAGEHLIGDNSRNNFSNYWRNLSLICVSSGALLVYDLTERGMQLSDPFFSIWSSPNGSKFAYFALCLAFVCSLAYFVFLSYKVVVVWNVIKRQRAAQLHKMSEQKRVSTAGIIYRFKFLMVFTLVCALSTIVFYMMKQLGEGQLHDDPSESLLTHSTSGFFTGTFGMWNIYVLLLLSMYAPSHKCYSNAQLLVDENEELMDPTAGATESAPMTTFFKASTD